MHYPFREALSYLRNKEVTFVLGGDENTEMDGLVKVGDSFMLTQAEEGIIARITENLDEARKAGACLTLEVRFAVDRRRIRELA